MTNNKQKISINLLRESIWGIEDKLKVIIESFTEQEATLKRHKKQIKQIFEKLNQLGLHHGR